MRFKRIQLFSVFGICLFSCSFLLPPVLGSWRVPSGAPRPTSAVFPGALHAFRPSGRSSLAWCPQCLVSLSPSCGKKSVHRKKVECTQAACQALPLHACRALPVLREAGCEQAFDTDSSLSPRGVGQPCPLCRDFFREMTGRRGSGRNLSLSG